MARRDFLGTAAAYPLRPDGRGGIALVSGETAVRDSIRAIIETQKGSNAFEPWFGWPLAVFKHSVNIYAVAESIKLAVVAGEDRIDPASLEVVVDIDDAGELTVSLTYSVLGDYGTRTLQQGFRILD